MAKHPTVDEWLKNDLSMIDWLWNHLRKKGVLFESERHLQSRPALLERLEMYLGSTDRRKKEERLFDAWDKTQKNRTSSKERTFVRLSPTAKRKLQEMAKTSTYSSIVEQLILDVHQYKMRVRTELQDKHTKATSKPPTGRSVADQEARRLKNELRIALREKAIVEELYQRLVQEAAQMMARLDSHNLLNDPPSIFEKLKAADLVERIQDQPAEQIAVFLAQQQRQPRLVDTRRKKRTYVSSRELGDQGSE